MPFACKICIMTKGLRGSEIASLPQTEEELIEHLKQEHGIIVDQVIVHENRGVQGMNMTGKRKRATRK